MSSPRTRVAVAGHTGRGDYGHELDRAFLGLAAAEVVAVADPDEQGRTAAMGRLGARGGYAGLEELLEREQPEVVVVAPRHLDRHRELVLAACGHGAHVFCEKPLAPDLTAADEMVEAAERAGVCFAVALPWAHEARAGIVADLLANGAIGELLGFSARTKCDHRGGGEDMLILGVHFMDMMRRFAGDPRWCQATVWHQTRLAGPRDVVKGGEGVGPVAGDRIRSEYGFDGGIVGTVESIRLGIADRAQHPYDLTLHGTAGALRVRAPYADHSIWHCADPFGRPERSHWERIPAPQVPTYGAYHRPAAVDLLAAIRGGREPLCSGRDGRQALEMVLAAYASHRQGGRVRLPLEQRSHPLMDWIAAEPGERAA